MLHLAKCVLKYVLILLKKNLHMEMKRRQSSSSIPCLIRIRNGTFSCIFSHFSNHEEMMKWQNNLHITNCAESKTQHSWNLFSRNLFRTSLWVKIFSLCAQAQHAKDGQCCTNLAKYRNITIPSLGEFWNDIDVDFLIY